MKKQILLTIVLLSAVTQICYPQYNKTSVDKKGKKSAVKIDKNSYGYNLSKPDTGGNPLSCIVTGSSSICLGIPGTLTSIVSGGTPPFSFLWSNGQTTQTIFVNPVITTTFTVTVTDAIAAQSNCNKTVTVNPLPPVLISGASSICNGSSTTWTASGGLTFSWSPTFGLNNPNTSNPLVSPGSTTTYTVTVTSAAGCTGTTSKTITVNPLPNASVSASGPTTFCDGLNVTLNAVNAANRTYQWKKGGVNIPGATSSSFIATEQGTHKVKVTNTVTGCSKVSSNGILVSINPLPVALISPAGTISFCAGQSAVLKATNSFGYTFQWKRNGVNINGATADSLTVTTAGKYKVVVTNAFFCVKTSKNDTVVVPCREDLQNDASFNLSLYPNPATDHLIVEFNSGSSENILEIYNALGERVMSKIIYAGERGICRDELNVTTFPAGLYVVNVITETGSQQTKMIIKE